MGILNVTPDSFYDGGVIKDEKDLLERAGKMLEDGATILDIGAVSTRPGSEIISTKEELERLLPATIAIRKHFPEAHISIDTFRSWVAVRIMDEIGPVVVNDISGGQLDSKMFETIGKLKVPYILTHMKGTPQNMQENPHYDDIVREISAYLSDKVRKLTKAEVSDVIIDPGFGFGKEVAHNYELLNRLDSFKVFQLPVMVGVSRKSMIWKILECGPEEALNGTTVINTLALIGGADILRVHDVKEAMDVLSVFHAIKLTL
ncbi:MAG: dihydropteroate synthase [Prolixibacteraceae bacterium]|nr:dihydropteroate synthase [Prolixibacteraceae bacterium]MBN2775445.1 dihydropteroate synthase [Prolixibacteraceae bacterium]